MIAENVTGLEDLLTKLENAKQTKAKISEVLGQAVQNYQSYLQEQSDVLVTATKKFTDTACNNDIAAAKIECVKSRVFYERIEPAVESFGDLDSDIDVRMNDVDSEADWTGFHVIERALWENNTTEGTKEFADKLDADVKKLDDQVKMLEMEPIDSHVKLAKDVKKKMHRRAFSYQNEIDDITGTIDAGLLFITFTQTPEEQYILMLQLMGRKDKLNEYTIPIGNGLYACQKDLKKGEYFGQPLFAN